MFRTWSVEPDDEVHLYIVTKKHSTDIGIHHLRTQHYIPLGELLKTEEFNDGILEVQNTDNEVFEFEKIGRDNYNP